MARHGENIRKRKDGRWEGRFPVYDKTKGKKIYRSVYGGTYEEVRKKLAEQKSISADSAWESGRNANIYEIKFCFAAEKWLEEIKNNKKPSTYIKYSRVYYNHIRPYFEDAVLSDITDRFADNMLPDHLSDSMCKSIYSVLNQILRFTSKKYSFALPILKKNNFFRPE